MNSINLKGENNPNYRTGNRMVGNFPCHVCNADRFVEKRNAHRTCRDCRNSRRKSGLTKQQLQEKYIKENKDKRNTFKHEAIQMYGNKCYICERSYNQCVYEFHHINEHKKDVNPSYLFRQSSWDRVELELRNCILLCSNCHKEVHWGGLTFNKELALKKIDTIWDNRASLSYS